MSIAVTLGDPNGVGPELAIKAHLGGLLPGRYIIVGDAGVLERCSQELGFDVKITRVASARELSTGLNVFDTAMMEGADVQPGTLSAQAGGASRVYVIRAVELALSGEVDAVVTLPVNKEAVRLTDSTFSGHTGLIAQLCGNPEHTMMLSSAGLVVTHISTHLSLRTAIDAVTTARIVSVINLTASALKRLNRGTRIAVAGLNPHAGEGGSFGREEIETIAPAVEQAKVQGVDVSGPHPPDTVFMKASRGQYDAVVAMYHDQGHIAAKLIDFEGGVNTTLGLPIVRTSVDHGTAFDIAYKGIADTRSLVEAYKQACLLSGAVSN